MPTAMAGGGRWRVSRALGRRATTPARWGSGRGPGGGGTRLLTDAVDARLIAENPVHRHRRRGPRVLHPQAERVWATPEQVVRVAEHASALGDATMGLIIITAAWTGMRWGETAGLQRCNTH